MSLFLRSSYRTAQENPGCEPCQKDWTQQSCLDVGGERPEIWSPTWLCHLLATWPKTTYLSLLTLCPCHKARVSDRSTLGSKYQQDCWRQPAASRHLRPSTGNSPPNSAGAREKLRGAYLDNCPCLPFLYCWWRGLHNAESKLPSCISLTIIYGHLPFKEHGLILKKWSRAEVTENETSFHLREVPWVSLVFSRHAIGLWSQD